MCDVAKNLSNILQIRSVIKDDLYKNTTLHIKKLAVRSVYEVRDSSVTQLAFDQLFNLIRSQIHQRLRDISALRNTANKTAVWPDSITESHLSGPLQCYRHTSFSSYLFHSRNAFAHHRVLVLPW